MSISQPSSIAGRVIGLLILGGLLVTAGRLPVEAGAGGQRGGDEKTTFLTLVVTADSVRLDQCITVPGVLKAPRSAQRGRGLRCDAVSPLGALLWRSHLGRPLIRHFEIEDPPGSGRWSSQIITLDSARVVLRLPARLTAARLEFYQSDRSEKTGGDRLIGTIPWPPVENR